MGLFIQIILSYTKFEMTKMKRNKREGEEEK